MAGVLLTGCTSGTAIDTPSSASPSSAPSGVSSRAPSAPSPANPEGPSAPSLDPSGSADDNLAYFDLVNQRLLSTQPTPGGRAIVDNLVAAGFDKSTMQVTADRTAIGGAIDSQQFSVRFGESCLIGQATDAGYRSLVGPVVSDNACLIGETQTIDW